MANYGLKYIASYDTINNDQCLIQILQKNYTGISYPLELSGVPVVQKYDKDEAQPAIKGCSLTLVYHNTGSTPITNFYSINDDEFKIIHYINTERTFEGYIVQDDCSEEMVDYRHEVTLSANDNIGLLKDVPLDQNLPDFGGFLSQIKLRFDAPTGECYIEIYNTDFVPEIGVLFTISGHVNIMANNPFTPIGVAKNGSSGWVVQVANLSFTSTITWQCVIQGTATLNLNHPLTLLNFIHICLFNTGLELNTKIFVNLFEQNNIDTRCFFEQVQIYPSTFYDGKNYKNCYEVLETILNRFKCTLFQCNGEWNIVRWAELRYTANQSIDGFQYDPQFSYVGVINISNTFRFGFQQDTYPETAPLRSIERPFKFDKETFNYNQPSSLINNVDLQQLGALDHTTTIGDYRYDYYLLPDYSDWQHYFPGSSVIDRSMIVIKTNTITDNEEERYVYQPKTNTGGVSIENRASVQFNDIPVSAFDEMDFSFRIKAASSTGSSAVLWRAGFILCSDEGSFYSLANGLGYFQWNQIFTPPDNEAPAIAMTTLGAVAEEYQTYTLSQFADPQRVPPFPIDGVLRIRMYGSNDTNASQPNVDAIWKDMKLTITANINQSTNIIGHVHNNEQAPVIKNNGDEELIIDDSPRTPIAGTMFLIGASGLVIQRTSRWYRLTNNTERLRIGEIITFEQLFTRRRPRTKIEGTYYNITASAQQVNILRVIKYDPFGTFNFIFGSLTIDFKNNKLDCTLYEMYEDGEVDSDLSATYTFTYLYSTK